MFRLPNPKSEHLSGVEVHQGLEAQNLTVSRMTSGPFQLMAASLLLRWSALVQGCMCLGQAGFAAEANCGFQKLLCGQTQRPAQLLWQVRNLLTLLP